MNPLDIDRFPLSGQSLIEASAGTGKTYTLSQLYRRLLTGHDITEPSSSRHKLAVNEILVVTFTKAAAEELRGRIRDLVRETLESILFKQHLEQQTGGSEQSTDNSLDTFLEGVPDSLAELSDWLQANLTQMDEASIFTIHSFCANMLKRFAFDSGLKFDAELITEDDDYLRRACEDIWRQTCYPKDLEQLALVRDAFKSPDALKSQFTSWLSNTQVAIIPHPSSSFDELCERFKSKWAQAKALWLELTPEGVEKELYSKKIDKRSYSKRNLPNWLEQVSQYFHAGSAFPVETNLDKFSYSTLSDKTKEGPAPEHAVFNLIDELIELSNSLMPALTLFLFKRLQQRLLELLLSDGVITNNDLIRLLDQALTSENGDQLAANIRALYPVAMIDEFQDTDAAQYRIFNRLYPDAGEDDIETSLDEPDEKPTPNALVMIGDPKQAIYAFRGADIFTYMKVRQSLPDDRRFTLDTNYRSYSKLVKAVNALWQKADKPFVFDDDIPFYPVNAIKKHDKTAPLWSSVRSNSLSPQPKQALQIWCGADEHKDEDAKQAARRIAEECATQIQGLLSGAAKLGQENDSEKMTRRPIVAGDIAVLVYSRKQAARIRTALSKQGIGSVYLTRDSVFDSQEALDILHILEAAHQPANELAVRRAFATQLWGKTSSELAAMQDDEQQWEAALGQMQEYGLLWQKRGLMAFLMQWLTDEGRAVRLRQQEEGERSLTNLLHLGELLQARGRKLKGHQALIRWLRERIANQNTVGDEAQLRLETDARLVNIVTIHKSKGLEYPMVFLPYLWEDSYEPYSSKEAQYFNGRHVVRNLLPDDKAKALQKRDNLAEKLRLLYVALTRARYGCYLWLSQASAPKKKVPAWQISALGYVLNGGKEAFAEDAFEQIQTAGRYADIYIGSLPNWQAHQGQAELELYEPIRAAQLQNEHQWYDGWRVGSYSQLAHAQVDKPHKPDTTSKEHPETGSEHFARSLDNLSAAYDWEASLPEKVALGSLTHQPDSIALIFPKGANPGTCLHSIFEHWDFSACAAGAERQVSAQQALIELCQHQLALHGLDAELAQPVSGWLQAIVQQSFPLAGERFSLSQLSLEQRLDEMEFYLPVQGLAPKDLDALLDGESRFSFDPIKGYIKGFIDLIFEWQGRYYVADYKSNFLGNQADDYQPRALRASMKEKKYDLQSWLYLLALDQLLEQRLPDYDPELHLGGSLYLYLRGMGDHWSGDVKGSGICFTKVETESLNTWREVVLGKTEGHS